MNPEWLMGISSQKPTSNIEIVKDEIHSILESVEELKNKWKTIDNMLNGKPILTEIKDDLQMEFNELKDELHNTIDKLVLQEFDSMEEYLLTRPELSLSDILYNQKEWEQFKSWYQENKINNNREV